MGEMAGMSKKVENWVGTPISRVPIGGGRNSQVYRLTTTGGAEYALKAYFQHQNDPRDRLGTEYSSLSFLRENSVTEGPQPIARFAEQGFALYEYIKGSKLLTGSQTITAAQHDSPVAV